MAAKRQQTKKVATKKRKIIQPTKMAEAVQEALRPVKPAAVATKPRVYMSLRKLERILRRLRDGRTLVETLEMPGMPSKQAVSRWVQKHPEARDALARARDEGEDETLDEVLTIADTATRDNVQVARLRVDARVRRVMARRAGAAQAAASVVVNNNNPSEYPDLPFSQWTYAQKMRLAQSVAFVLSAPKYAADAPPELAGLLPAPKPDEIETTGERVANPGDRPTDSLPAALRDEVARATPRQSEQPAPQQTFAARQAAEQREARRAWERDRYGRELTPEERAGAAELDERDFRRSEGQVEAARLPKVIRRRPRW